MATKTWAAWRAFLAALFALPMSAEQEKAYKEYENTVAALKALADDGEIPAAKVAEAMKKYGVDGAKPAPWTV